MSRARVFVIRKLSQLRALASPVRQQILAALEARGPSTARELADHVGRLPESLYYHLRALRDAGLVLETGSRPGSRRDETEFGLPAPVMRVDPDRHTPAWRKALARGVGAILRAAERDYAAAVEDPTTVRSGPRREVLVRCRSLRLSPHGLAELNRRLDTLFEELECESEAPGDNFYALTTLVVPTGARFRRPTDSAR